MKPKGNNGFEHCREDRKGAVSGPGMVELLSKFLTQIWITFGYTSVGSRIPGMYGFYVFHFFKTITFSNSIPAGPAGLKRFGPDLIGFRCFHLFKTVSFQVNNSGPRPAA